MEDLAPADSVTLVRRERFDETVLWVWRAGQVPQLRDRAVAFDADRSWMQRLLGVLDAPPAPLARPGHHREAIRWDATGVSVISWRGPLLDWPVEVRRADTGCPVRYGGTRRCRARGGPFVQVSRDIYDVWEQSRQELVAELGCDVCRGREARQRDIDPVYFPGEEPTPPA